MIPYPPYVPPSSPYKPSLPASSLPEASLPASSLPRRRDSLPSPPPTPIQVTPSLAKLEGGLEGGESPPAAPSPSTPPATPTPAVPTPKPSFKPPAAYLKNFGPTRSFPVNSTNGSGNEDNGSASGSGNGSVDRGVQTDSHSEFPYPRRIDRLSSSTFSHQTHFSRQTHLSHQTHLTHQTHLSHQTHHTHHTYATQQTQQTEQTEQTQQTQQTEQTQRTGRSVWSCRESCSCPSTCSVRRYRLIETGIPSRLARFPTQRLESPSPLPPSPQRMMTPPTPLSPVSSASSESERRPLSALWRGLMTATSVALAVPAPPAGRFHTRTLLTSSAAYAP